VDRVCQATLTRRVYPPNTIGRDASGTLRGVPGTLRERGNMKRNADDFAVLLDILTEKLTLYVLLPASVLLIIKAIITTT
jgi:hypothetical protein